MITRLLAIIKKRSLHQVSWVMVGSLINGLSLLTVNALLARIGEETYGIFSTTVIFLSTVAEMSDFGLNAGLLRFAPYYIATNQNDKLKQLLKIIWRWRVSLTVFLSVGCALFAYPLSVYIFKKDFLWPYLAFSSLGIGGVILLGLLGNFLQAQQRFERYAAIQSLKGLLRLIPVVVLFTLGIQQTFLFIGIYILVPWILFLANYHVFPKGFRKHEVEEDVRQKLNSQLTKFSFWLTASSLIAILASRVDQAVIIRFLGIEQQAIFSAAHQLLQFFPLILNSITAVVVPKISGATTQEELKDLMKKTCKWVTFIAIPLAILIYPSQYLIQIIFGEEYRSAMPLYLIFAYGTLMNIITIPFSLSINIFKKTHLTTISVIVQFCISIIFNFVLIPKYGILGAGYTFLLMIAFQSIWYISSSLYFLKKAKLEIH